MKKNSCVRCDDWFEGKDLETILLKTKNEIYTKSSKENWGFQTR